MAPNLKLLLVNITIYFFLNLSLNNIRILEFAHYLGKYYGQKGIENIQVFADSHVALNGRRNQRFIDPNKNLLEFNRGFKNKSWSVKHVDDYGYIRLDANSSQIFIEFIRTNEHGNVSAGQVWDSVIITRWV